MRSCERSAAGAAASIIHRPAPARGQRSHQVNKGFFIACVLLVLTGCGQWQTYRCVRDTVNRNEPYLTPADREDSEALAWQACRERGAAREN